MKALARLSTDICTPTICCSYFQPLTNCNLKEFYGNCPLLTSPAKAPLLLDQPASLTELKPQTRICPSCITDLEALFNPEGNTGATQGPQSWVISSILTLDLQQQDAAPCSAVG